MNIYWAAATCTVTALHLSALTKPPSVFFVAATNRGNATGSSQTGDALGKALASVSDDHIFNLELEKASNTL